MLELLRIRNFLYTHGPKIGYDPKFSLDQLTASVESRNQKYAWPVSEIVKTLLMELIQCREYNSSTERPLLSTLHLAMEEGIRFELNELTVPCIQSLFEIEVERSESSDKSDNNVQKMDPNFQDNPKHLKVAALRLMIECLERSDRFRLKNKDKEADSKVKEGTAASATKQEKFAKRFFAGETCKYLGHYTAGKVTRKVFCYREDKHAVYAIDQEGDVVAINSIERILDIVKAVERSTVYEERQLVITLKTLVTNHQLVFDEEPIAPTEKLEEDEEEEFDFVNAGIRQLLNVENQYSEYLDQFWGSRWRCSLPQSFNESIRKGKTLIEKARVVSNLWDNCGRLECLYFENNKPTIQVYKRKYTVADMVRMGGYLVSHSEERPLEKISTVKNLFNLELGDPSPTVFYICCELIAIELDKYTRKKKVYLTKVRAKHEKANSKEAAEPAKNARLHRVEEDKEEIYRGMLRDRSKKDTRNLKVAFSGLDDDDQQKSSSSASIEKYANARKFKKQTLKQTKLTDMI